VDQSRCVVVANRPKTAHRKRQKTARKGHRAPTLSGVIHMDVGLIKAFAYNFLSTPSSI
jgi:hypothetical protein